MVSFFSRRRRAPRQPARTMARQVALHAALEFGGQFRVLAR
jgi:hypothetical protein